MMVRRYVVKDMPEAVLLIRKDLGKDAIILSTKKIRIRKWMGLAWPQRIEVMAVASADISDRTYPGKREIQHGDVSHASFKSSVSGVSEPSPSIQAIEDKNGSFNESLEKTVFHPLTVPHPLEKTQPMQKETPMSTFEGLETVLDETSMQVASGENLTPILQEMAEIKRMLYTMLPVSSSSYQSYAEKLLEHGVDAKIIEILLRDAQIAVNEQERGQFHEEVLRDQVIQFIMEKLSSCREAQPIAHSSRIVAFVGPTGVGKTTTVAKLAALHVLAGQRKVGLITTDTYRIAAVEQLRTYSNILNVPLEVIQQGDSVQKALDKLADRDLILVDTAGRNFKDPLYVQDIQQLLSTIPVDETYLVLSMTMKSIDLHHIANIFAQVDVDKFLFTKMDETSTYGAILDLLFTHRKPVSYVTTGQNVPDDIEVPSLEKLIEIMVGGAA